MADETARLDALRALEILDTPPEGIYDDVVFLAAAICQTPTALINFIDADRQWAKALFGSARREVPRSQSFCARTITEPDGIYVVEDAGRDPDWADHPDVGEAGVQFYAGASIIDDAGYAVGSVCVVDTTPRHLSDTQIEALRRLARQTAAHLRLRVHDAEMTRAAQQLRHEALHDSLTGLASRAFFEEMLELSLRQRREGHPGVLFCDLNHFKQVNDQHGHAVGDELLRTVAQRVKAAARDGDIPARMGGDEFAVLCPGLTSVEDLAAIAARLRTAVAEPVVIADVRTTPSISIGLGWAQPGESAASVLRRADEMMYADKRARRSERQ